MNLTQNLPASLAQYTSTILGGGGPNVNPNSLQGALQALRQYDPNASITTGVAGDNATPYANLVYDPTKLPGLTPNSFLQDPSLIIKGRSGESIGGGYTPAWTDANPAIKSNHIINQNLVQNNPVWGNVTPRSNIKMDQAGGLFGVLDKILPYAVMGTLGYGAGLAGTSLFGGLGMGGALGSTLGKGLGSFALQELASGGNAKFNPLSLVSGAVGAIPGMGNVMPYLNTASNIYGATQGNLGSIANLVRMGLNYFNRPGGQ